MFWKKWFVGRYTHCQYLLHGGLVEGEYLCCVNSTLVLPWSNCVHKVEKDARD